MIGGKVYDFSGYMRSHPGGSMVFERLLKKALEDKQYIDATEEWDMSSHPKWVDGQMKAKEIGVLEVEEMIA